MANIMINDLTDSVDLDQQAMAGLTGGHCYHGHYGRKKYHRRHRPHRWCHKYHGRYKYPCYKVVVLYPEFHYGYKHKQKKAHY